MESTRVCNKCNTEYPITEFRKREGNTRHHECRLCRNKRERMYYMTNPEKGKARRSRWEINHKEQRLQSVRKWQNDNREKHINNIKNWRIKNSEYIKEYNKNRSNHNIIRLYGLSLEDYELLFIKQDGRCAICEKDVCEMKRKLHVDHDHKTGAIRGLLCLNCNRLIGNAHDDVYVLKNAIDYLRVE